MREGKVELCGWVEVVVDEYTLGGGVLLDSLRQILQAVDKVEVEAEDDIGLTNHTRCLLGGVLVDEHLADMRLPREETRVAVGDNTRHLQAKGVFQDVRPRKRRANGITIGIGVRHHNDLVGC